MSTRTAFAVGLILIATGCASPADDPSTSPTLASVTSASPSLEVSASPTPSQTAGDMAAGPLQIAGELSFGSGNFGGLPYGQAVDVYQNPVSYPIALDLASYACGDDNFPSVYATSPTPRGWELFLMTNWDAPGVQWLNWDVESFLLVVPSETVSTSQLGPVGPRGLRLGTEESVIEAMFPAEAAATTTRSTDLFEYSSKSEVTITERVFSIGDIDGGPMIITTVDGHVATIMWGNPDYVSVERGFLRCVH